MKLTAICAKLVRDQWLTFRGLKYGVLRRRRNRERPPIHLYWWRGVPNFGDCCTPDLVLALFGYHSEWTQVNDCDVMGAGSLLELAIFANGTRDSFVWGSGFIRPDSPTIETFRYVAVRGKLSAQRLPKESQVIPVGDPGLLANLVYSRGHQTNKVGLVPHYVDVDHPVVAALRNDERFVIIDVGDTPAEVARQISSCSLILSSSLHGLVFADSFGVPNFHLKLSDALTGGDYKFTDYYSASGRDYTQADISQIFDDAYLQTLRRNWVPFKSLPAIQRGLVRAFPFK